MQPAMVLLLLLAGHALADYPLQGEFMANAKNRNTQVGALFWPWVLPCHALIHGAFVAVITGSVALGVAETAVHGVTDWLKCENKINIHVDQAIHVACKVLWFLIWLAAR